MRTLSHEEFWSNVKVALKSMHGSYKERLPSYLDEIEFRWNHRDKDMFNLLLQLMKKFYPCHDNLPLANLATMPVIEY